MNATINGLREKIFTNPPLYDDIIFLIYVYIKTHLVGKFFEVKGIEGDDEEVLEESHGFSETEDSESLN